MFTSQESDFVNKLTSHIQFGFMPHEDEYKAAIFFLVSNASSYMSGANIAMDGRRIVW